MTDRKKRRRRKRTRPPASERPIARRREIPPDQMPGHRPAEPEPSEPEPSEPEPSEPEPSEPPLEEEPPSPDQIETPEPAKPSRRPREKEQPRRGLFGGLRQEAKASPYPPFSVSVARGLLATGGSPVILIAAFLSTLAVWGALAAIGTEPNPKTMVLLMAVAPVHVFGDANQVLIAFFGESGVLVLVLIAGLAVLRALTFGFLTLLLLQAVAGRSPSVRDALAKLPKVALATWAIFIVEVGVVLTLPFLFQGLGGPGFGSLAVPLVLILGLHFLVMAPVVAAAERVSSAEAFRRGFRAARLPGLRHFALAGGYFAFALWLFAVVPASGETSVTPSIGTWAFTLLATFVHVGLLGAFVYRWLLVRDQVPAGARRRR